MKTNVITNIQTRYAQVHEKVTKATLASGRKAGDVRLVVVTKTHPLETVLAAIEAGSLDLGENYADEAVEKIKSIGAVKDLKWHMIGHVQSRKAALVAQNFDFVHSVDSLKLADRLDRFANEAGRKIPILLECNVGAEISKSGFPAFDTENWEQVLAEAEKISNLPNLEIHGLMSMPPFFLDADRTRPFFKKLRGLRDFLSKRVPQVNWRELSMGTSTDYVVAIEEGATIVRIGTAILGERPPQV